MPAIVAKRGRFRSGNVTLLGVDLSDAREEIFVRLVCDGLSLGVAFIRAGFTSKAHDAASNLFHLPRVQERAAAILEARKASGAVSLPEVTDMLKRVFAGAHSEGEYSAAHNAAFSLARLYGHVTDRASIEVIRRPSRDPDAPSEQALASWVEALPALAGPEGPGPDQASFLRVGEALRPGPGPGPEISARDSAPAAPLGPEPIIPSNINALDASGPEPSGPGPSGPELSNEINWLAGGMGVGGRPENGAPSRPVTGTPDPRAHSGLLGPEPRTPNIGGPAGLLGPGGPGPTPSEKGAPVPERQVPGTNTGIPSFEELFG